MRRIGLVVPALGLAAAPHVRADTLNVALDSIGSVGTHTSITTGAADGLSTRPIAAGAQSPRAICPGVDAPTGHLN